MENAPTIPTEAELHTKLRLPEPFDGYPYLVTRIGQCALRHLAVLPADWPRAGLLHLVRRQAETNRLETCLCLGPSEAIYVSPNGSVTVAHFIPTGIPVVERLALAEPVPRTEEVAARRLDLEAYAKRLTPRGCVVGDGLEAGRPAAAADIARLAGSGTEGVSSGLSRCVSCRGFAGDYLALRGEGNGDHTPRVIQVHCRCENHNCCAGCGQPLGDYRLSAFYYHEAKRSVVYVAAYSAFGHHCR